MDTYGMHSASEILQQDIQEITIEGCEGGARKSQDNIILWGSFQNQLDISTEQV